MSYKILRPPLNKSFELPTREELLAIRTDQLVKIIFQSNQEMPERMWVRITDQSTDTEWKGLLDNDPEGASLKGGIKAGDAVAFHPLDVIQIFH